MFDCTTSNWDARELLTGSPAVDGVILGDYSSLTVQSGDAASTIVARKLFYNQSGTTGDATVVMITTIRR